MAQPHREGVYSAKSPGEQLVRPTQGFAIIAVGPVFFRETGHADAHAQNVGSVQPGVEDQVIHQPPQLAVIIRGADEWDLQPLPGQDVAAQVHRHGGGVVGRHVQADSRSEIIHRSIGFCPAAPVLVCCPPRR